MVQEKYLENLCWERGLLSLRQMVSTEDKEPLAVAAWKIYALCSAGIILLLPGAKNSISTSKACLCCPMFVLVMLFIMLFIMSSFSRNTVLGKLL